MKKRYGILLLLAGIGLGLFFYNYWSYSCGRCNAESLLMISVPAGILIGTNLLALGALVLVKNRRSRGLEQRRCRCGLRLHPDWQFCPTCGQVRLKPG